MSLVNGGWKVNFKKETSCLEYLHHLAAVNQSIIDIANIIFYEKNI